MPLTLGILAGQDPEPDLRAGWQRFLVLVGLAGVAATGLSLFAGEAAYPAYGWEQVAPVGDLVDDVLDQLKQ